MEAFSVAHGTGLNLPALFYDFQFTRECLIASHQFCIQAILEFKYILLNDMLAVPVNIFKDSSLLNSLIFMTSLSGMMRLFHLQWHS